MLLNFENMTLDLLRYLCREIYLDIYVAKYI